MEYTEAKNLPGILLFIDFRKAFNTIEWNFLHKCIELYNFGPNIRKWISILYFKLLHRILVTNKELKQFGITDCEKCVMCSKNDSIEHAFFECQSFLKLTDESLQWFNSLHKINVCLTSLQCFLNLPTPTNNLSNKQTKDLRLLLLYAKLYHYTCKRLTVFCETKRNKMK